MGRVSGGRTPMGERLDLDCSIENGVEILLSGDDYEKEYGA
jgi:hypothetical protein